MKPVRLTVGFLKGGTSKTTTAFMLAWGLALRTTSKVHIADADTVNPSTWHWYDAIASEAPPNLVVKRWASPNISEHATRDMAEDDHLIIDTGPSCDRTLRSALHVTDLLVVPVTHSAAEADRIIPTVQAAVEVADIRQQHHAPPLNMLMVMTRVNSVTKSAKAAREAIQAAELPLAHTQIKHLEKWKQAFGGLPPADLDGYDDLLTECIEVLDGTHATQKETT